MGTRDPSFSLSEQLQGEAAQLRALARGLLFDRHGAEDVVQEAWLALLSASQPPREAGAWLMGTVRRLARQRLRQEARRGRRERAASKQERVPAAVETSGRIEILRRLLAAVEALDEPYREVVVLRFLDDLPPREIARRTGLPVNTVRTRARRGIERLRSELDGEHAGRRGELLAVLAPLAGAPPWSLAIAPAGSVSLGSWTGTVLMTHKLLAAGAVAALLALAIVGWRGVVAFVDPSPPSRDVDVAQPRDEGARSARPEALSAPSTPVELPAVAEREALPERAPTAGRPWIVRGLALDPGGNPVADLPLELGLFDGYETQGAPRERMWVETDAEGRFQWPLELPEGAVVLLAEGASAEHYVYGDEVPVLGGGDAPELRVKVYSLDLVAVGRTLDEQGVPVAGALVEGLGIEVRGDGEGRFRLPTTSQRSTTRLSFSAAGFADTKTWLAPTGPGELEVGEVLLARELRLGGVVRDEAGSPLEGVAVRPGMWGAPAVESDDAGRFEVGTFDPRADMHWLELQKDGYALLRTGWPTAEFPEELELVLVRGGELRGRVVDGQGRAVEAAQVTVGNPPNTFPHRGAWSDPDGRFTVTDIEPGARDVWVTREGFASFSTQLEIPRALDGAAQAELVLYGGSSVGGLVVDPDGVPVSGVLVYAEGVDRELAVSSVATDAGGRFVMEGLPESGVLLGFLEQEFSRLEVENVAIGRFDHVFRLLRAGRLEGRVVDAASGAPIESFRVRLVSPRLEEGEERLWGYSSLWASEGVTFNKTDGSFEIADDDLEAGKVIGVEIRAEGYALAIADHALTVTDPDPDDLVIRMDSGGRVRGRVVEGETGAGVADALVRFLRAGQEPFTAPYQHEPVFETTTDSQGGFVLEGLPRGVASLVVEHERFATALDGPFDPDRGGERVVALHAGATLEVRLADAQGSVLSGESLAIYRLEPRQPRVNVPGARTGDDGVATFDRLQPGTYQVSWARRLGNTSVFKLSVSVELAGNGRARAELRPSGTAVVEGTLEIPAGLELPEHLVVHLIPRGEQLTPEQRTGRQRGTFSESGRFVFEGVSAGSYWVRASFQIPDTSTQAIGSVEVDVGEGELREVWLELQTPDMRK